MKSFQWLTLLGLFCLLPFFSPLLASCTRTPAAQYAAKDKPLNVEASSVTRLEVIKRSPGTGDVWTATVARVATQPGQWRIESGPAGSLGDRMAAGRFIDHLLDTFHTFAIENVIGQGEPERFGLMPPEVAFRFSGHEVRLGQPPTNSNANGGRYAVFPPDPTVYTVNGATLAMLEYLPDFTHLREQTFLAPLESDDIDEIELLDSRGKSLFYAQREGESWTNRKHQPWKGARGQVSGLLDTLTHSRIRAFIDDEKVNHGILTALEKKPLYQVKLTRRGGKSSVSIRIAWQVVEGVESLYGTVESRPGWAFQLYPELIRSLEPLR